ncbi:hypothetical protein ACFL2H_00930 [Planctomycetota bacterium]
MLAATADIVFLVDESGSQASNDPEKGGDDIIPWIQDIVPDLEEKLTDRGIGDFTATDNRNRFAVVTFGDDVVPTRIQRVDNSDPQIDNSDIWVQSEDIGSLLDDFTDVGQNSEDGWLALANAVGVQNVDNHPFRNDTNEPLDLDGSDFEFRSDAAVYFILVADEIRAQEPSFGPTVEEPGEDCFNEGECHNLFFHLIDQMQAENINTGAGNPNVLNDAILTTVAPYKFNDRTTEIDTAVTKIYGVDAHILDAVNVDRNAEYVSTENLGADVVAGNPVEDMFVVFGNNGSNKVSADVISGVDAAVNSDLLNDDYQDLRVDLADPFGYYNGTPGLVEQSSFDSEGYAFLTWEARGTAWDFEIIRHEYDGGPFSADVDLFNQTFVDDTFEKIKLQIADFNHDGKITGADVDAVMAPSVPGAPAPTAAQEVHFNLDGSTNPNGSAVDLNDVVHLYDEILMLWLGDSNGDGVFNSADFVQVFGSAEYEDGTDDNSTWSEGDWNLDFDFTSADFVAAFNGGGYSDSSTGGPINNNIDDDGDGDTDEFDEAYRVGMVPIWMHTATVAYFPHFSD